MDLSLECSVHPISGFLSMHLNGFYLKGWAMESHCKCDLALLILCAIRFMIVNDD